MSVDRKGFVLAAAAAPFWLRAPDAWAGGTPLVLVTADTQSHVAVVDPAAGRILRRIETLPGPRSIEAVGGGVAVVAHTAGGVVSLIGGRKLSVQRVLGGFREPRYTAAHPNGRYAFVTDSGRGEVVTVDVVRGRVVGRVAVGGPARHISLDRRGRRLWVALGTKAALVAVVDTVRPERPRLVARLAPPFLAHDVALPPARSPAWVTSGERGTIALYDARRGRILRRLPADAPPQHVTFHGGRAFVASGDDGLLRIYDADDGRLLRTTRVPLGSYNVQQAWGTIVTPSLARGTLCVLDAAGRLRERVQVAPSSHDACLVLVP
jgi:DNA-binding beta-propeller fold protein YncE